MSFLTQLSDRNLHHKIPFLRIGSAADRRHQRHDCFIISSMSVVDRALMFDGVVDSISVGGLQFRPASRYILDRRGDHVSIALGHRDLYGTIVAVRQTGYGIALRTKLSDTELFDILSEFE